ncbi:hypothetical protein AMTRI_Chr07g79640 [Amborella trichopoda]
MWFASTCIDKEQQTNDQEANNATVFGTPMMAPPK